MKKIKNNGFVLAEAIVVSIFVLGMFTYLAMNVLPLIGKYDRVLNYDNPQEIYLANTLYEELIQTHGNFDNATTELSNQKKILNDEDLTCDDKCKYYKTLIGDYLKIGDLCVNNANNNANNKAECSDAEDRGMKEYYNYFEKQHPEATNTNYVLIKFNNGRYANIIWQWEEVTNEEQTK